VPITDIPILSMLRTKMNWNQDRQKVLAENVANSDTPNYRERDLAPVKFEDQPGIRAQPAQTVALATTETGHIGGMTMSDTAFNSKSSTKYEVRPTGNSVTLEDEMMKVSNNQMDYEAATALYTRSLKLIKVALGKS
jgi:flagellar basal-body rod protein FlgB